MRRGPKTPTARKRRASLNVEHKVAKVVAERKVKSRRRVVATADGWEVLPDGYYLHWVGSTDGPSAFAQLDNDYVPRGASRAQVFSALMPESTISTLLEARLDDYGETIFANLDMTISCVFHYFAVRMLLQGNKRPSVGVGLRDAIKEVTSLLKSLTGKNAIGVHKFEALLHGFVVFPESEEHKGEERLWMEGARRCVMEMGDTFALDEKLFRFVGRHCWVRKVPPKPDKLGLWHYQGNVQLSFNDHSLMVYTRTHALNTMRDEHIPITDIIDDCITDIKAKQGRPTRHKAKVRTVVFVDSYYGTPTSLKMLSDAGVRYTAKVQRDRFEPIADLVEKYLEQAGDCAYAYNSSTHASLSAWWHPDNESSSYLLSTAMARTKGRIPAKSTPGADHYKNGFSFCDTFNKELRKERRWPFVFKKGEVPPAHRSCFDFLFLSLLVNSWFLHFEVQIGDEELEPFASFVQELAAELLNKY
jgi:hypothetical protein